MNAFLRKEFRESVRWLPLGWLLMGGMLWMTLPGLDQLSRVTQLSIGLGVLMAVCASIIALGLSIAQFGPDQRIAARAFLLHRGLSTKQLYQGKLIIGCAVYALAVWLPLLIATLYLEWIGPLRLPTSARQTIPAWVASVYAFSFYFGGSMVACSNARWLGTRILPLAMSALVTLSSMVIIGVPPLWALVILAVGGFGIFAMFRSSQEAFENGARRVAPGIGVRNEWSRSLVLTQASIVVMMTVLLFPTNFTSRSEIYRQLSTDVDASGELWFIISESGYAVERAKISSNPDSMVIERLTDESPRFSWNFGWIHGIHSPSKFNFGPERIGIQSASRLRSELVYDPSGYILAYTAVTADDRTDNPTWLLSFVVSEDRVTRSMEPRGKPFKEKPVVISKNWFVTKDGVYRFDNEDGTVNHAVSMQVDGYDVEEALDSNSLNPNSPFRRLFLYGGSKLLEYHLPTTLSVSDSLQPEATLEVGTDLLEGLSYLRYKSKDEFSLIQQQLGFRYRIYQKRPGQELEKFVSKPPKGMQPSNVGQSAFERGLVCMAVPVAYYLVAGLVLFIVVFGYGVALPDFGQDGGLVATIAGAALYIVIQCILACVFAYAAARHRGLSKRACVAWAISGALGGFGIALAIIAIYAKCIREACSSCKGLRRVELLKCEHCGSDWDLPAHEGIEVLEAAPTLPCVS